jgi:hypothetical protein
LTAQTVKVYVTPFRRPLTVQLVRTLRQPEDDGEVVTT